MEKTGVTVMRMAEAMDAGPILLQASEPIGTTETATELATRLSEVGAEALVEVLALLEAGEVEEVEQDHDRATFAPKLGRETARVDWNRPARELGWHLRGLDEVPGAWTTYGGEPFKLFGPHPEPRFSHNGSPGTVLEADYERGLLLACGGGAIWVAELQPPGKKRMEAGAWLRGHPLEEGARFE
jgi:methionyl-tRNA formyltransferase